MPIIKSAKKAARQTAKRTEHNVKLKKDVKAALKAFKSHPTAATLAKAQSEYDKAAKKNLIKKNTASRRKAKLHKLAQAAGVKLVTTPKKPAKKPTTTKTSASTPKKTPKSPASKSAKAAPKKPESKAKAKTA